MKTVLRTLVAALALASAPAFAQDLPREWDGMTRVESRNFDAAYIAPGANFSGFTKVMLDPTEVAFERNWQRDHNRSTMTDRISDDDAREILEAARSGFEDEFVASYRAAGYEVVTTPAPDVVRLRTAVLNLNIVAPDNDPTARSFSREAGGATFVLEARNSMSGALLARGVDSRIADNAFVMRRTQASNTGDFRRMFHAWAEQSVEGFAALRAMPTVPEGAAGQP